MIAIADEFVQDAGYQGQGFGMIESYTAGQAALGELACGRDEKFVDLRCAIVSQEFIGVRIGCVLFEILPPWVLTASLLSVVGRVKLHGND